MTPHAREQNINPIILREFGRDISILKDLGVFWKLVKILKSHRPHIVHTHTAKAGTVGRLAAWVANVPVKVHTFHGHVFEGYFHPAKTRIFIWVERILALVTDRLLVLSERQRKDLTEKYRIASTGKFQVVPLGFDLDPFLALPSPDNVRFENQPVVIGFVGRLVSIKNPMALLEAFRSIVSPGEAQMNSSSLHFFSASLWFIGGGPLEDTLIETVQHYGLNSLVKFWGWQQDPAKFYKNIDVVVLSSINEGTPVALIEAMASQRTFISTDVGGVRDLMVGQGEPRRDINGGEFTIFENGILVQSDDPKGLVGAMRYMLNNPEQRRAMGRVGREYARGYFSRERLLADIQKLYEEMLIEKGIYISLKKLSASLG